MKKLLFLTLCISTYFLCNGQDHSGLYLYGKVTTIENDVYEGQLRWGKEEAFWFDMFNSSKPKNENLRFLSDDQLAYLDEKDRDGNHSWVGRVASRWGNWNNWDNHHSHSFACQFGEIKELEIRSRNRVSLTLKDGSIIDLKGGSNDIGADVQVNDESFGLLKLNWDRIAHVSFQQAPSGMKSIFGEPLFGRVKTYEGTFEGYIQWDHDERLTLDELDGDTRDGDLSIPFENIGAILKDGRGSTVVFKSGNKRFLTGSNDVNSGNRGIIVNRPGMGRVDIPWDVFEEVSFATQLPSDTRGYDSFSNSKRIAGVVETITGETLSGVLTFDLDEERQLEILDGNKDDIDYLIPFHAIAEVKPVSRRNAVVILTNGEKVVLENKVDVSESNDGVLVFEKNSNDPEYVAWEHIKSIKLR